MIEQQLRTVYTNMGLISEKEGMGNEECEVFSHD